MKKNGVLVLLIAAMLVAIPVYGTALAAQRGPGPNAPQERGWQHPVIAPEKQAAFEKITADYRAKVQPLRNDLWAKHTELEYLSRGNNVDPKDISRLVADMKSIREKMQTLHENTAAKLAKDLNIASEHAFALLGRGGCGMGPCGMGRSGMGAGFDGGCGDYRGDYRGGHRGWHR